jgi:dihydroorotate dehydrogenase (NAD+) catalytic subunit
MIDLAPNNPYGLSLATPLLAAAGCLGYGSEVARSLGFAAPQPGHGLGALITRTTTLSPRRARPLPALVETPGGLLYCGVEHNPGLRAAVGRHAGAWATWSLPVIVSLGAASPVELAEAAGGLEGIEGVAAIEIALGYCGVGQAAEATRFVAAARAATLLPLLVRLPGQPGDLPGLARAAEAAGADALALSGGLPGLARSANGDLISGLLCGPAIRPLALAALALLRPATGLPIIAGGGVSSAADAQALLDGGAAAVAIGSLLLGEPGAAARIAAGLKGG